LNDLILLLPEIIITVAAFLIITLDIIWNGDERSLTILPWVAFAAAVAAILATLNAWPLSSVNNAIATDGAGAVPMLAVDPMALFFKILSALTVALVGLSSVDYLRAHTPFRGEFFGLTLLAGLSLMLMSSATNLVMIYLSVEFLSITSYILTTYLRTDARSTEAGLKYLLYGAVASGVMLYGFSLLYGATGSVDLATIAISIQDTANVPLIVAAVILILTGLGFKIALVPFHQWSPDAYEGAPTPITAFLSVGPKVAGFAVLIRILVVALPAYDFNWTAILVLISILTIAHFYTVGHLTAVTTLKQMDPEFEAVSQSLKAPFYRTFARVTVPVAMPALLDISIYLFLNAMTTVSAVVFLYSADTSLASVAVLNMDDAGDTAPAAAMAMMIAYTCFGVRLLHAALSGWLTRRTQAWRRR
jgi:proton-translocating NADH-quinone oxidoreductase chain N